MRAFLPNLFDLLLLSSRCSVLVVPDRAFARELPGGGRVAIDVTSKRSMWRRGERYAGRVGTLIEWSTRT